MPVTLMGLLWTLGVLPKAQLNLSPSPRRWFVVNTGTDRTLGSGWSHGHIPKMSRWKLRDKTLVSCLGYRGQLEVLWGLVLFSRD